jgi:hypothetical protein
MKDLSIVMWPNATTRLVFETLILKKSKENEAIYVANQSFFKLAFEQTDFSSFSAERMRLELEEFYDFGVQDFVEIMDAARNNPIGTHRKDLKMGREMILHIFSNNKSEIDFDFIAELILE